MAVIIPIGGFLTYLGIEHTGVIDSLVDTTESVYDGRLFQWFKNQFSIASRYYRNHPITKDLVYDDMKYRRRFDNRTNKYYYGYYHPAPVSKLE